MESPGGLDELSLEKIRIRREHLAGWASRIDLPGDCVDLSKDGWLLPKIWDWTSGSLSTEAPGSKQKCV
jgi:hypothetical protein